MSVSYTCLYKLRREMTPSMLAKAFYINMQCYFVCNIKFHTK